MSNARNLANLLGTSTTVPSAKVANYDLPIVFAYSTASQNLTATTWTDVTIGTEVVDTQNIFASSVFTLPAGKYLISTAVDLECSSHNNLSAQFIRITQDTSAVSGTEVDQYMNHTGNNFTSTTMRSTIIHNASGSNTNAMRVQTWANWGAGTVAIKRVQLSVMGIIA
jgi:hypothetical protein|tara:strand:- start:6 stop:509 length:504 start_codon:yes stop_codon:yes gene_type:complete